MIENTKYKFSSRNLKTRPLEDCGDGPLSEYRKKLDDSLNITSANRGRRTVQHSVATHEQTKKGLSFLPQKNCRRRWNTYKTLTVVKTVVVVYILIIFEKV